jgi:hypothetical protein
MAFPPNYNQERNNRARNKQRKAEEKLARREEKSALRKRQDNQDGSPSDASGDQPSGQEERQD